MPPILPVQNASTVANVAASKAAFKHLIDFAAPGILSDPVYRPLAVTFIEYLEGDTLGLVLAWFSMLPFIYTVSLCTLILFRRDIQTIMYFGGFSISTLINHYLKLIFKQARPERTRDRMGAYEVHGMPSGHSQAFFYFMSYVAIFVILKAQMPGTPPIRAIRHRIFVFGQLLTASLVAYSRVYLYYHTIAQVVVGGCIGTLFGALWYYIVNYQFIRYVPFLIDRPLARYLLIRDYTPIPHIIHFQYESEYAEAKRCRERLMNYSKEQTPSISE